MKKWVLLLLLLASCVAQPYVQPVTEKTEEKIVEKVLVQCWDNSTVESIEQCPPKVETKIEAPVTKVVVEQPPVQIPIAKKLLADARNKFKMHAYVLADRMVIVGDNKIRHLFFRLHDLPDRTTITDVFVDLDKKQAVAYCNIEREGKDMTTDGLDWERAKCKDYVDKPIPVPFEKWVPKGPMEYLEEFSDLEPVLVEDNMQTISIGGNQKTIQPSLHYDVGGRRIILRIDKRYQIPIKIERQGEQSVDFRDTFFDVMVLYGSQEKLGPEWLTYTPISEYWKAAASK